VTCFSDDTENSQKQIIIIYQHSVSVQCTAQYYDDDIIIIILSTGIII
jgi:hypothetical protein